VSAPGWPLVARALLLACALGAAAVALFVGPSPPPASGDAFLCPMHPEVRRSGPGDCPVCGMALVPAPRRLQVTKRDGPVQPALPPGSLQVARRRILTERRPVPAWVDADGNVQALVPEEEVQHLPLGAQAGFLRGGGAPMVPVHRTDAAATGLGDATSRVGFAPAARSALVPGTPGWIALGDRPRPVLIVPSSAVLQSPAGAAVLVSLRGGTALERRPVRLGEAPDGLAVVLWGLEENEEVVVRGAFFLDAQRRLGSSVGPGGG
jgi:hypothetical protein